MSILDTLDQDISQSLRAKDELALLTFRQTKTALQNAEIANGRKPLSDEQVQKVLRSEVKKRRDAIELYQRAGAGRKRAARDRAGQPLPAAGALRSDHSLGGKSRH